MPARVQVIRTRVSARRRYRKKGFVTAVRVDLDTEGFRYRKWGADQFCKRGDWLVKNHGDGETYTVDAETFAETYEERSPGIYVKTARIWAEPVSEAGSVETKEGVTHYEAGDFLVSNEPGAHDSYAIPRLSFERTYEPDD